MKQKNDLISPRPRTNWPNQVGSETAGQGLSIGSTSVLPAGFVRSAERSNAALLRLGADWVSTQYRHLDASLEICGNRLLDSGQRFQDCAACRAAETSDGRRGRCFAVAAMCRWLLCVLGYGSTTGQPSGKDRV